jgi:hypothetical protein
LLSANPPSMHARTLLVVGAMVACRKPSPSATTTTDVVPASCASTVAAYDGLVAAGGACSADADCACFNGGVSTKSACGGVTDHATAAKLEKLTTDYEHGRCDALSCAATLCSPACSAGRCVNAGETRPVATVASATSAPTATTASWTSCTSDADCTYVSLGCCDTTPVNRAHVKDAQRKLDQSGHPHCPPKAACGPSADGTWSGAPGKCTAGSCVLRSL